MSNHLNQEYTMQTPYTTIEEATAAAKVALLSIVDAAAAAYAESYASDMQNYAGQELDPAEQHRGCAHEAVAAMLGELAVGLLRNPAASGGYLPATTEAEIAADASALRSEVFITYAEHGWAPQATPAPSPDYVGAHAIVRPAIEAAGADPEHDLVRGLLAYAAAMDLIEAEAGGTNVGEVDPARVAAAKEVTANYWHPSNTADVLERAEAFAEGFYENA